MTNNICRQHAQRQRPIICIRFMINRQVKRWTVSLTRIPLVERACFYVIVLMQFQILSVFISLFKFAFPRLHHIIRNTKLNQISDGYPLKFQLPAGIEEQRLQELLLLKQQ